MEDVHTDIRREGGKKKRKILPVKELTKKPKEIFSELRVRIDPLAQCPSAILNHVVPCGGQI